MAADQEHEATNPASLQGASVKERLIEACRSNNTDLLSEIIDGRPDDEISALLNNTKTVLGNYLYHEAASRGNYEIIDLLLDQPDFECDPINRAEGDTPLHSAIRWLNAEPPAQRSFGSALVSMMLEAGSSTRIRNRGGLTPLNLVDPANKELRHLLRQHEYTALNAGDFINVHDSPSSARKPTVAPSSANGQDQHHAHHAQDDSDDAQFSASDDDEREEWERRKRNKSPKQ
ncbi:hypothetical protein CDD82_6629 [Ophiocordyceps australis]|uniref:Uncharacterized protein n=1 Tax=Ophiocordyceps australis TaxID=1399860 RepID=A0A2C5ZW38_9HYPO|nr:hypothetical protein CDD82_6629 [Ophiocordyceps australis]